MPIATDGKGLEELVRMAVPICQQAERDCPRTGPGRKPQIPDWVLAVLIMVVVAKRKKSKSAQFCFLVKHQRDLMAWMQIDRFPARATYFDRYRRAHTLFRAAIKVHSTKAVNEGLVDPRCVAVDKSLVRARGPNWHNKDRKRGRVPRGVDRDSTWTRSTYHGWVQGYGYEVVVTASKTGPIWPLLASVEQAHVRESRTFPEKIAMLPATTRYVLADAGYDSNELADAIERTDSGTRRHRRFVCPLQERHNTCWVPKKAWRETRRRKEKRLRRNDRRTWMAGDWAKSLYGRRQVTVEPFNERFKGLFEIRERAWHRGLENNRTQVLAAIFVYQLLLRYNHRRGLDNARVAWILDAL